MKLSKDGDMGAFLRHITGRPERGDFMTEELKIATPEGADDTAPPIMLLTDFLSQLLH